MSEPIMGFKGEHRWLSNFWPAEVSFEGIQFPSTEHAYQAAKTLDLEMRQKIAGMTAAKAKGAGKKLVVRPDWNEVKLSVMDLLLRQKFAIPELRQKLIDTGEAYIEETNHWGDVFWGVCKGKGENHLGKLIMVIRSGIVLTANCTRTTFGNLPTQEEIDEARKVVKEAKNVPQEGKEETQDQPQ